MKNQTPPAPTETDNRLGSTASLGPILSESEVAGLKDGERVSVVWSGGNGPHEYEIGHTDFTKRVAVLHRLPGIGPEAGKVYRKTALESVGATAPRTVVRRVLPNAKVSQTNRAPESRTPHS
jgi:hypothetical protein